MSRSSAGIWLTIFVLAIVDLMLMIVSGIFLTWSSLLYLLTFLSLLLVISLFYFITGRSNELLAAAHTAAQFIAFFAAAAVFSYLVLTADRPLVDDALVQLDRAIGFDWMSWFEWVQARPTLKTVLNVAYGTSTLQLMICIAVLSMSGRYERNRELMWSLIVSLFIIIPISGLFPAESAWIYYSVGHLIEPIHMPHFTALREGTLKAIDLREAEGLITFPSFHTTLAIVTTYAFRQYRILFLVFAALNLLVVVSVPTEGGHYGVDVIAGAVVAMVAILSARYLEASLHSPYRQAADEIRLGARPVMRQLAVAQPEPKRQSVSR